MLAFMKSFPVFFWTGGFLVGFVDSDGFLRVLLFVPPSDDLVHAVLLG